MLQWIVHKNWSNWNFMHFLALWTYWSFINTTIIFTPFQLLYGIEVILLIECEIPSLKIAIKFLPDTTDPKKRLSYLEKLEETYKDVTTTNEVHEFLVKA